tara:strand:+ start:789 stop:929 length:141 start_codon:yes stop_codon:yes gene_type:complete
MWEFAIIERFNIGPLIGFSYFPKENEKDFDEFNIYLIFFALHFKFY